MGETNVASPKILPEVVMMRRGFTSVTRSIRESPVISEMAAGVVRTLSPTCGCQITVLLFAIFDFEAQDFSFGGFLQQNDAGILPGRGCSRLCSRNQSKIIEVLLRKVCGDFTLNVRHMDN